MKLTVNIEKMRLVFFLAGIVVVMGIGLATAFVPTPVGHGADQVGAGTFAGGGGYVFPSGSNVTITEDLIAENNVWGESTTAEYASGAHIWTTKTVDCPDGYYVTGMDVVYRGTCHRECDADGGIVGGITLHCKKL